MRTNRVFKFIALLSFAALTSSAQVSLFYQNGKAGYKNTVTGEIVVPAQYPAASSMMQTADGKFYAFVYNGTKTGYINDKGEVIIPFIYDDAAPFSEGVARVKKEGKYGYINFSGQTVIPFNYTFAADFRSGKARVEQGGKYGFIDTHGNVAIGFNFYDAGDFSEGVAPVMTEQGSWGFINAQGNFVIQPSFTKAESFKNGEALVHDGEKFIFINLQGNLLRERNAR
jgi:hypothetical protein